jgi:hypothetical protein
MLVGQWFLRYPYRMSNAFSIPIVPPSRDLDSSIDDDGGALLR